MRLRVVKVIKKIVLKIEWEYILGKILSDKRWRDKGKFKEGIYKL